MNERASERASVGWKTTQTRPARAFNDAQPFVDTAVNQDIITTNIRAVFLPQHTQTASVSLEGPNSKTGLDNTSLHFLDARLPRWDNLMPVLVFACLGGFRVKVRVR